MPSSSHSDYNDDEEDEVEEGEDDENTNETNDDNDELDDREESGDNSGHSGDKAKEKACEKSSGEAKSASIFSKNFYKLISQNSLHQQQFQQYSMLNFHNSKINAPSELNLNLNNVGPNKYGQSSARPKTVANNELKSPKSSHTALSASSNSSKENNSMGKKINVQVK